jgi:tRNA pseudouridine32 synthase/23S rRNA pseudouridine746 synthase
MKSVLKLPLPVVEGVGPSRQWLPKGPWQTVLQFLCERFPHVETAVWLSRMEKGEVMNEKRATVDAETPYAAGSCIFYYRELESEIKIPFAHSILYRDEHLLVADKPHFLPVVPSGRFLHETLLVRLRKKENLKHLVPLHRIDRETAGVVLFSLNPETRSRYAELFNNRKVNKVYEALAGGGGGSKLDFPVTRRSRMVAGNPFFRMREIEGEPNSETRIDLIERMEDANLYRLRAVTGKKHQIRLHLAALGIPIVNDKFYPEMSPDRDDDDFSAPLKLLAKSVSFRDPVTNLERFFESGQSLAIN